MAEDKAKKSHGDLTSNFDRIDFGMNVNSWSKFEEKLAEKYFQENKKYQAKK